MTTWLELQDKVARRLSDPDNGIFPVATVKDFIASAWAEIDDIAPDTYQEDITPVAGTLSYQLRAAEFPVPNQYIQPVTVELWDGSVEPPKPWRWIAPKGKDPTGLQYSQVGWFCWAGSIYLPNAVVDLIDPTKHLIRVWGYSPWVYPDADEDVIPFGNVHEEALVIKCQIEAYRALQANRSLFTQWQTRSNNTDMTIGGLMNLKAQADAEWRVLSRRIQVLRETP